MKFSGTFLVLTAYIVQTVINSILYTWLKCQFKVDHWWMANAIVWMMIMIVPVKWQRQSHWCCTSKSLDLLLGNRISRLKSYRVRKATKRIYFLALILWNYKITFIFGPLMSERPLFPYFLCPTGYIFKNNIFSNTLPLINPLLFVICI